MPKPPAHPPSRREVLNNSTAAALSATAATVLPAARVAAQAAGTDAAPDDDDETTTARNAGRIYKSLKWYMVQPGDSTLAKFQLIKDLGYDGIEIDSPGGVDKDEAIAAAAETGLPITGVVNSIHWQTRLSDPDEAVREQSLEGLITAIHDADRVGSDSVLLVPGTVKGDGENESHNDVWNRSIPLIRRALPLCSRLGIRVLIENVWNGFCYDPQQLADYIDEVNSPWLGVHFDVGNHRRWGLPEDAIRTLGPRIAKLDVKEWSQADGFSPLLGEGDVDWPAVCDALEDIGYTGWAAAEVAGGDRDYLADIAARMDRCLQLA